MSTNFTDYSGWTYSLPQEPQEKDWKQLQTKLKSYAESSKFLRQGSTVDQYDPQTGKRVKRPITDVVHKITPADKQGVPAQDLRSAIRQALITGDRDLLRDVSKYRYVTANKFVSQKEHMKQQDKATRRRILAEALAFGGAGSLLGLVPYIGAKKKGYPIDRKVLGDIATASALGAGGGLLTTGIIQSFR